MMDKEARLRWLEAEAVRLESLLASNGVEVKQMNQDNSRATEFVEVAKGFELSATNAALAKSLQRQLIQVLHATKLVNEGKGYHCELCGEPIPLERIDFLPYATICCPCLKEQKKDGCNPSRR